MRTQGKREPAEASVGRKYGRLTVLRIVGRDVSGCAILEAQCECDGNVREYRLSNLKESKTHSCGCIVAEKARSLRMTSGMYRTDTPVGKFKAERSVWRGVKRRCTDPSFGRYEDYGLQGVKMFYRWRNSFAAFLKDMGERPGPGYELDRTDNDGPYAPWNCRWVPREVNQNNKATTRLIEFNGRVLSLSQWARELGISKSTLHWRLKRGRTVGGTGEVFSS
jgi:hypothetical protein